MTEKRFTTESERINSSYSIRILEDGDVIFEVSNWDSLSTMHKRECEDIVDLLNELNNENELLKKEIMWWKYRCGEDISGDVKEFYKNNVKKLGSDIND